MISSIWRYKWYIIAAAFLSAVAAYGLSSLQETVYRAEGTVLLNDPRSSGGVASEIGLVLDPRRYVRNQAKIMESPQVAQRAADNLGTDMTGQDVQEATSATPASDLDAITVVGSVSTATGVVDLVNALVVAYEEIITEQIQNTSEESIATLEATKAETQRRISGLDASIMANPDDSSLEAQRTAAINQLVALDTRIELLATNTALYGSGVQLYVEPNTPMGPDQPQPQRNAAIALVAGAVAAAGWAWWTAEKHQVADNKDVPARVLDAPLLASIPDFKLANATGPIPTITTPESGATEAYQFALSSLGFALERVNGATVLITSPSPGDGKSATAINLAIAAAQDGRTLTLIDADERAQGLTQLAGLRNRPGVSDLDGPTTIKRSTHRWAMVDGTTIDFIPAGTGVDGNTATFFRSDGFRSALTPLLDTGEMVILDSPPVMAAAETTDLSAAVDGIVLVIKEGTRLRQLDDARKRLSMSGTPIIGYIFNRATSKTLFHGYGYGNADDAKNE